MPNRTDQLNIFAWLLRALWCLVGVAAVDYVIVEALFAAHAYSHPNPFSISIAGALLLLLVIATLLARTARSLAKKLAQQQHALRSCREEGAELQRAYQEVLENLPIGLFTYHKGKFEYTNWAWDEQILRHPEEAATEAFSRAVHPDDRQVTIKELDRCYRHEEPVHQNLRLLDEFLEERTIEMRGVPVYEPDGTFRHLLGFNIDISEAARATAELRAKAGELELKNQMLITALTDLESNFTAMVESLVKAVEAKDPYTAGHSERVMQFSVMIGDHFGLDPHQLKILRMGTLIHDIGKIGIPDEILTKPSGLTPDEYEAIKRHSELGYEMIQGIPMLRECAPIVRLHHERLDGSGYPLGLAGDDIPLLVRISSVADVFDAMTSNRAYRRGLPARVAIDELRVEAAHRKLDAEIVEAFARALARQWPAHDTRMAA